MKLILVSTQAVVSEAEYVRMTPEDMFNCAMSGIEYGARICYDDEAEALDDWEELSFCYGEVHRYDEVELGPVELICHGLYSEDGRLMIVSDFDADRINADLE